MPVNLTTGKIRAAHCALATGRSDAAQLGFSSMKRCKVIYTIPVIFLMSLLVKGFLIHTLWSLNIFLTGNDKYLH